MRAWERRGEGAGDWRHPPLAFRVSFLGEGGILREHRWVKTSRQQAGVQDPVPLAFLALGMGEGPSLPTLFLLPLTKQVQDGGDPPAAR